MSAEPFAVASPSSGWWSRRSVRWWSCLVGLVGVAACQVEPSHRNTPRVAPPTPKASARVLPSAAWPASGVTAPVPSAAASLAPVELEPCPAEMVAANGSCIDRFEAHLMVRTASGALAPHPPHQRPVGDAVYVARSTRGVLPQAYISRIEAERACANAGKRLCSVQEWYGACRGKPGSTYPYGAKFERGRCNVGKPHLLSQLYGTNPRSWKYDEHFNNPGLNQLKGFLEPTGKFDGCRSSFGVQDMVGNLHEWVADRVDRALAHKIPMRSDIKRGLRKHAGKGVFVGGFFSTTSEHGYGCGFITIAHEARYHDYSTGFRCCRDLADEERTASSDP